MNPRRPRPFRAAPDPPTPQTSGRLATTAAVGEGPPFLLGALGEPVPPNGAPGGPGGELEHGGGLPGFLALFGASFVLLGSEVLCVGPPWGG